MGSFASYAFIVMFGVLGVSFRYALVTWIPSTTLPWSILAANALGSFAAGLIVAKTAALESISPHLQTGIMIGLLGGLTTFSSFAIDTVRLFASGNHIAAFGNFILNNFVSITLCYIGYKQFSS